MGEWAWCPECELYFVWPQPSQDSLDAFYASETWTETSQRRNPLKPIGSWVRAWHRYRKLSAHFASPGRMLDMGCGDGAIADRFAKNGWDATGVDYEMPGSVSGKYDLVVFSHSIEHMLDPVAVLKRFSKLLTDRGLIYIEVPLFPHPDATSVKEYLMWSFDKARHMFNYTPESIEKTVTGAGMEVHSLNISVWVVWKHPWYLGVLAKNSP